MTRLRRFLEAVGLAVPPTRPQLVRQRANDRRAGVSDPRIPIQRYKDSSGREWAHLVPLVQALIEAGHEPIDHEERYGFKAQPDGWRCELYGVITLEDWEMLNERFMIPEEIRFTGSIIRDAGSWSDIDGWPRDMVV